MNWTLALEHNQAILLRNVAWLFAWLRLEVGGSVETMSRLRHSTILFVLRPSESAYRRLILVAVFVLGTSVPLDAGQITRILQGARRPHGARRARTGPPPFKLTDTRKHFDLYPDRPKYARGPGPRVTDFWSDDPVFDRSDLYAWQNRAEPTPDDEVSAASLCLRMSALHAALNDLPGQAKRMAKLQARIAQQPKRVGEFPLRVMRPGLPPGFRKRHKHEVDEVLAECHRLVFVAVEDFKPPDTS